MKAQQFFHVCFLCAKKPEPSKEAENPAKNENDEQEIEWKEDEEIAATVEYDDNDEARKNLAT